MATSQICGVIQHLRSALLRDGAGLTDGQLLEDYLSRRDEAALAALVRRHGPMVWGVCRRVLWNHHDPEDAFQATFLVLVRKAASIASRELLANWLYGVAHRTALKARATAARKRARERQVTEMPEPKAVELDRWHDLQPLLDQELSRLPEKYRVLIVLCDLDGKTRREAARQLGVPEGTVAGRLARARAMLAKRLALRGVVFSGSSVAALVSAGSASASAPPALVASTIQAASLLAAGGFISVEVAALTEGVMKAMFVTKIKSVLAVVLVIAAIAGAAGLLYQTQAAEQPKAREELPVAKKDQKKGEEKQPMTKEEKLRLLIEKVLAAHGGEDKLNKLQFTMTVKHNNEATQQYFVQPPKNFRSDTTLRTGKRMVILFPMRLNEGMRWFNEDGKEFFPLATQPPMEHLLDSVRFAGPRQVLRLKDADHRVTLLDEEVKIDGRAAVGVEVTGYGRAAVGVGVTGPVFKGKMYFDKETHLLLKSGSVTYSDYKKFDGIQVAQKMNDGSLMSQVTDFRAVDKFDAKLFEQP